MSIAHCDIFVFTTLQACDLCFKNSYNILEDGDERAELWEGQIGCFFFLLSCTPDFLYLKIFHAYRQVWFGLCVLQKSKSWHQGSCCAWPNSEGIGDLLTGCFPSGGDQLPELWSLPVNDVFPSVVCTVPFILEYYMSIISLDSLSPSEIPIISLRTVTAVWLWWCIPNLMSPIITSEPKFYTGLGEHILVGKWLCVVFLSKACWQNSLGRCLLQSSSHWPSCDWNKYPCCCVSHLLASIKSLAFVGVL